MKNLILRALAETLRVISSAILAAIGLSASGCACVPVFNI